MALNTRQRTTLYEAFQPIVGAEVAELFLDQFPSTADDELVTKNFLRAELAELRSECTKLVVTLTTAQTAVLGLFIALAG